MAKRKLTPGEKFWVGLVVYTLAADAYLMNRNHDSMSVCFGTWLQTPRGRLFCAAGAGALVAHLFWSVPIPFQTSFRRLVTYDKYSGKRINGSIVKESDFPVPWRNLKGKGIKNGL